MRVIAIVNQKGGCGKTITTVNLGAFLAREPRRVLIIDMDPQAHATLALRRDGTDSGRTIHDALIAPGRSPASELRTTIRPIASSLDLVPADIRLSAVSEELAGVPGREDRLARALEPVRAGYDYTLIDCPPNLGLQTFMALKACSEAIIPVDPSFFSLHGIAKLLETLEVLARKTGHAISARALITLYPGRSEFVRAVADELRTHLADRMFATTIRYSAKLAEAASHALPVADYCRRCAGFEDYSALAQEVLLQEQVAGVAAGLPPDEVSPSLRGAALPVMEKGVLFTLSAPGARCVQLAGDFNGWKAEGGEMEPKGDHWQKTVLLPPGRYSYRYVVDGCWQADPLNPDSEVSPFGELNSIVVVPHRKAG